MMEFKGGSTDGVQLDPTTGFGVHDWARLEKFSRESGEARGRRNGVCGRRISPSSPLCCHAGEEEKIASKEAARPLNAAAKLGFGGASGGDGREVEDHGWWSLVINIEDMEEKDKPELILSQPPPLPVAYTTPSQHLPHLSSPMRERKGRGSGRVRWNRGKKRELAAEGLPAGLMASSASTPGSGDGEARAWVERENGETAALGSRAIMASSDASPFVISAARRGWR
nr:hypothetical protein Iba_chr14eCG4890 [Ipomoea batatas]